MVKDADEYLGADGDAATEARGSGFATRVAAKNEGHSHLGKVLERIGDAITNGEIDNGALRVLAGELAESARKGHNPALIASDLVKKTISVCPPSLAPGLHKALQEITGQSPTP